MIEGKGTEVLLHALARIRDDSLQAEIAGEGPARDALESLAHRLGIAPRVHFRGPVNDMAAFWQTCDLAVVPSHPPHVESFGIVAIEAMASGLPVVATANGALPELVTHGRSGTIVPKAIPTRSRQRSTRTRPTPTSASRRAAKGGPTASAGSAFRPLRAGLPGAVRVPGDRRGADGRLMQASAATAGRAAAEARLDRAAGRSPIATRSGRASSDAGLPGQPAPGSAPTRPLC